MKGGGRMALPMKFDVLSPAVIHDPYPAYAELRASGPLCRGGPGVWVVPRHGEVAALLTDRRLTKHLPEEYLSLPLGAGPTQRFLRRMDLLMGSPPIRRRVGRALAAVGMDGIRARLGQLVAALLDPAAEAGRFDAVSDLAFPLPVMAVGELLGVPEADRARVRACVGALVAAFSDVLFTVEGQQEVPEEAVVWLEDYLGHLVAERRARPAADLLSVLVAGGEDPLAADVAVDLAMTLFYAAFETTMGLLSTGCAALLNHPGQLATLRADPGHLPAAVEEFLRYDAPIQVTMRMAKQPLTIGERTIRPGRVVVLLIGSANHDEHVFPHPERLDLTRHPNPHLSFGGGIHHCLGAALARTTAHLVFDHLLHRFTLLEPDGEQVRQSRFNFRSFKSIPVRVKPA